MIHGDIYLRIRRTYESVTETRCRRADARHRCAPVRSDTALPLRLCRPPECSRHGEIQELQNRRPASWWDPPGEPRPLPRSEQWQSRGQPGLLPPRGHSSAAGRTHSDRNNPQTGSFKPAAPRTRFAAPGRDSGHVSRTHVPVIGAEWAAPRVRVHRLHAADTDLPRAPEGSSHGGIAAPGALDPRRDHDATAARLQL